MDAQNVNRSLTGSNGTLCQKEGTQEQTGVILKPAQKIALRTAIVMPADATVPKLIVQRGDVQPVLRIYFKPGDIKPLSAPFADPADKSGATARTEVPAAAGEYWQSGLFDVKLLGTAYVPGQFGNRAPEAGHRFFVATFSVKNPMRKEWTLNGATFACSLKTDDGEKTRLLTYPMMKAKREEPAGLPLQPGEEYTVRIGIPIPADAKATQLSLREGNEAHFLVFDVSSTQP